MHRSSATSVLIATVFLTISHTSSHLWNPAKKFGSRHSHSGRGRGQGRRHHLANSQTINSPYGSYGSPFFNGYSYPYPNSYYPFFSPYQRYSKPYGYPAATGFVPYAGNQLGSNQVNYTPSTRQNSVNRNNDMNINISNDNTTKQELNSNGV